MRRIFITAMMAVTAVIALHAQTANNDAVSISWALDKGTITDAPDFTPIESTQFFQMVEITKGSGLNNPVAKTSEVEGITQTMFPVTTKTSSASEANTVSFLITVKEGIAFTPAKVSFKSFRWKTDKGNFDAAWLCDDTKTTLATGIRPNRGSGSGASTVSSYDYATSSKPLTKSAI